MIQRIFALLFLFAIGAIEPVFADTTIFQSPLVWRNDAFGDYLFKDNGKLTGTRIGGDGAVEFVSGPATYELLSPYQANAAISSLAATWRFEGRVSLEVSATGNSADYTTVTNGVPITFTKSASGNLIRWRATLLGPGSRLTQVRISYADASGVAGSFGNPELTGFNFQKTIWIKGGDRDHYLFQVPINVGQSGKSKRSDVTLKGVLQADFDDVYFTLDDAQTPLPFYREGIPAGAQTARFWVKIPQIPKDGLPIYMFYGRLNSFDLSNPESVFDFYYDFKDTVFNDTQWQAADLSRGIIEYKLNSNNTINSVDRKTLTTDDQIIAFFKTGTGFAWVRQRKAAKTMPLPDAVKTASFAEEIPDLPGFQGVVLAPNGDVLLAHGQVQGTYTSSLTYPTQPVRIMIPEWKTGEPPPSYKEGAGGVVPQVNVDISATADTAVYDQNCLNGTYYYASRKDFTPGEILAFRVRFSRPSASSLSPRLTQFSLDFRPGTISLINPAANENVQAGSSYNIVWSALDYEPSYKMNLAYSSDGGNTYQPIAQGVPNSGNSLWQVPTALTQTAKISVIDSLDNTIYGGSAGYFSVVSSNGTGAVQAAAQGQMTPAETTLNQEITQQVVNPAGPRPGTKLYEILVKVGDAIPGNTFESASAYKQGDIVVIAPAGHKWSKTERSSFVIVQAYLFDSEVSKFVNPDMIVSKDSKGRQSVQQIGPRRYMIDLVKQGLLNKNWQAGQQSGALPTVSVDAIQDKAQ